MKIVFVGCVESSKVLLETLLEEKFNIVGVLTKNASSFNTDFFDLTPICEKYKIPVKYVENINDTENITFIQEKEPDYIYCFGWSQLFKSEILTIPQKGSIGYHCTALPANRGRHPLIWALVLGLKQTASTFFALEEDCDSGEIYSQVPITITYEETAASLYEKVLKEGKKQVISMTKALEEETLIPLKQDESKANIWRKRGKLDGQIDFRMSSFSLYNLVRGLSAPYPFAHFANDGKEYKVYSAKEVLTQGEYANIEFGKVINVYSDTSFLVKTGDHLLHIEKCDPISLIEGDYL